MILLNGKCEICFLQCNILQQPKYHCFCSRSPPQNDCVFCGFGRLFVLLVKRVRSFVRASVFFSSLTRNYRHCRVVVVVFQCLWQQHGTLSIIWFSWFITHTKKKLALTKAPSPLWWACSAASPSRGGNRCCCYLGGSTCSPPEWGAQSAPEGGGLA